MSNYFVAAVATTLLLFSTASTRVEAQENLRPSRDIESLLEPICREFDLPGMIGGIVEGDRLKEVGAVGVRKVGDEAKFTIHDKVHLGSCGKAFTATRLAMAVEAGQLRWDETLAEALPELKRTLHADFRNVTLAQLLTHGSGAPANAAYALLPGKTDTERRRQLLLRSLSQRPAYPPGKKMLYSNVGYSVAAYVLEHKTGKPWEQLIREGLLEPLKITTAGFGPPGENGKTLEPWGHIAKPGGGKLPVQTDNLSVIAPAGTMHMTLADWSRFVALHLEGAQGKGRLLKPETFRRLHASVADDYAYGWLSVERPWGGGRVLTHTGSNTTWFAVVWMAPKRNFAVLAATNQGGEAAAEACDRAAAAMIGRRLQ